MYAQSEVRSHPNLTEGDGLARGSPVTCQVTGDQDDSACRCKPSLGRNETPSIEHHRDRIHDLPDERPILEVPEAQDVPTPGAILHQPAGVEALVRGRVTVLSMSKGRVRSGPVTDHTPPA